MTYNFDELTLEEVKTELKWLYNAFVEIFMNEGVVIKDSLLKKCVEIAIDNCGSCHDNYGSCQCWNDE